jgi:hypothetical protein
MMRRLGVFIAVVLGLGLMGAARAETLARCARPSGEGWLERTADGVRVMHLKGTYYDMGYEHAKLMEEETQFALRAARSTLMTNLPLVPFSAAVKLIHLQVYQRSEPYIPAEFKEEMRGLADGSGVRREWIEALQAWTYLSSCAGAAAWGKATPDGELYFVRSNDIALTIDVKTGRSYQDLAFIAIYEPVDGQPYMMVTWPGLIGASEGMNASGIAVGNFSDPSRYETPAGVPMLLRVKQAVARARNLDEAVALMTQKPLEGGYNFLVADAKIPDARAIEMNARTFYVGGWDGAAESNRYTYQGREYAYTPKEDLLSRTNHPLSAELIADFKGHIDNAKGENKLSGPRYFELRARLEEGYGGLNLDRMMKILRGVYASRDWERGPTLGATSHQLAFAPKSGEILIAICSGNPLKLGRPAVSAFSQPVHRLNFFELLKSEP